MTDEEPAVGAAAVIQMRGIRRSYDNGRGRVDALSAIDLEVRRGEFVAIVGPRGSGKSTLLNLIGCLEPASEGSYRLLGEEVAGLGRDRLAGLRNRRVGLLFPSSHLLPRLSVGDNVELPMRFGDVPGRERRERVAGLLARVGLAERSEDRPGELSPGEMQRVAIARALAMDPDLLLADEPTRNLDAMAGGDILGRLEALCRQGTTLLLFTRDPALARRAGRVIEIHGGRIVRDRAVCAP